MLGLPAILLLGLCQQSQAVWTGAGSASASASYWPYGPGRLVPDAALVQDEGGAAYVKDLTHGWKFKKNFGQDWLVLGGCPKMGRVR